MMKEGDLKTMSDIQALEKKELLNLKDKFKNSNLKKKNLKNLFMVLRL